MNNIRWLAATTHVLVWTISLAAPNITVGQKLPPTIKTAQQPDQMPDMQTATPPPQQPGGQSAGTPEHAQASGPGLRLEDLEQMALKNNPTLSQAAAEVRAASGRKQQAGLYPNPMVGYEGAEIRGGSFRGGEQGFFVQQNIVLGGKLGLSRQVFEQERQQASAEASEQRLRVLNNVHLLFYQALAAQKMVDLQRELGHLANDVQQTSRQLANVGQADQPDVLQAEVESEQAQLALFAAEQNQQRIWKALAATVGTTDLAPAHLEGDLEAVPDLNEGQGLQTILTQSPTVKIAEASVRRGEAALAQARRLSFPDLQLRGGLQQNRELSELSGRPVGLQGFAEVGVQVPIFNRSQGNVAAARAELERSQQEVRRVQLLLRERSAVLFQDDSTARATVERYKSAIIPRARRAYDLYLNKYQGMQAAYPQVLIAQRTLFRLQADYITALQNLWTNWIALNGFLVTDGLEAPTTASKMDLTMRETNLLTQPFSMSQR
jgi:cobalt-zinc-cadmium efflux system outer membrane protein